MASLADHSAAVAEELRRRARIAHLSSSLDAELLWSVIPNIALSLISPEAEFSEPRALVASARNLARALGRTRGPSITRIGTLLVVSTSVQTSRVLEPISQELETRLGPRTPVHPPVVGLARFDQERRRATRLVGELRAQLAEGGCDLPPGAREEVLATAIVLARTKLLFAAERPALVLVASQHNSATRAVLAAARDTAIRTAYIPHAPVAENWWYRDLPVQHALLRGAAEVEFYRAAGVDTTRLAVVGDPSVDEPTDPPPPRDEPVMFATTPAPPDDLLAMFRVVAEANLGAVEVAPHPRMDSADLREISPPEWTFNPLASTYDRLATQGAAALVQYSSGVGLEALGLGVAVVNLVNPGREPNYPYLNSPHVANVSSSDELRTAIAQIDRGPGAAEERRLYARTWCARVGRSAATAAADAIVALSGDPGGGEMLLDGWPPVPS
jgi:hypothetical protein